jgi:hypothetical protein
MTAAVKNLTIEQKATFCKRLTYKDKSKKPVNLTGFSAHMQVRDASGALIVDLSTTNGSIALGGILGTIDLTIAASDTTTMTFASALYDLTLISPSGTVTRLLQGKVTLSPGQTE